LAVMQGLRDAQIFAERHTKKSIIAQTLLEEAKKSLYSSFDIKSSPV